MNKTIDALKLAEEALLNTGNALMVISAGRNLRQLYGEMRDDAVERCNKALAAIREALAEHPIDYDQGFVDGVEAQLADPVKQEPVAHYKDAPHTIYLQTGCDDPEDCECSFNEWGDTTWCVDQIHDTDIPYIRADYAAPISAKLEWGELPDYEIVMLYAESPMCDSEMIQFARAVITAFKEKNR